MSYTSFLPNPSQVNAQQKFILKIEIFPDNQSSCRQMSEKHVLYKSPVDRMKENYTFNLQS